MMNQNCTGRVIEKPCGAGACYHALGYHKSAVRDYNAAQAAILTASPDVGSSPDARQQQSLAFYQRELAQYVHKRLDWRLNTYFLDKDISPVFKGAPSSACTLSIS